MLNLLAVCAAAWSPQPLVRPGRTALASPPCSSDNGLLGHAGGSDLSRQWLLQELASELLSEERAPSKTSGAVARHTRSFPYMTRTGAIRELSTGSIPYVSTVATPTRSASCCMMARGKPAATSRRSTSSNPEPAQPVAAMLRGVGTIVSATGAAAGALLCRKNRRRHSFGQLALRWLLSAPKHASGCPSFHQPLEPLWPAPHAVLSTQAPWLLLGSRASSSPRSPLCSV